VIGKTGSARSTHQSADDFADPWALLYRGKCVT